MAIKSYIKIKPIKDDGPFAGSFDEIRKGINRTGVVVENIANNRMKKSIDSLSRDFATVRTGRANTALVENLMVDYYGAPTPLSQLGSIIIREARVLQIQPWDKNSIKDIEKSIYSSDLGVVPQSDGESIIVNLPPLTEERRKQLVKGIGQKSEDARVSIRNIRRDIIGNIKTSEKSKEISEDVSKRLLEKIEKVTTKYIDEISNLEKNKNIEILEN